MNIIVNKALLYKEWLNVRWMTLLTTLVLIYFKFYGVIYELNLYLISNKRQTDTVFYERWLGDGLFQNSNYSYVMIFMMMLLTIILFAGEKNSASQGFISSMPFTRKEIIINKWIIGVFSILISFAVTWILLSLIYALNINTALDPYSYILKWFFIDTFEYICIFTFLVFVQTVMGNSLAAVIVGAIIPIVPYFIIAIFRGATNIYPIGIDYWSNIYGYNTVLMMYANNEPYSRAIYNYSDYSIKLIILFLLTCLFLYLSYLCYTKRKLEYNLKLISFKYVEPVFNCGVAVCFGLLVGSLAGLSNDSKIAFFILSVVFGIAGYFISKLLIKVMSSAR